MVTFPMLAISFFMNVVAVVFVICGVVLILTVLIQKGRGGGLGAAFGGSLASGILGSKTGDFLTWVTIAMVGVFLLLAVVMAKFYKPGISSFGISQPQQTQQLPAQQPPPQQELPAPASDEASQAGGPQDSEMPSAPAENSGEGTDINWPVR